MIQYKNDSGLGIITLASSATGNRLNQASLEALQQNLYQALGDDAVRVILIRSDGSNWCLGMDLQFLQDRQSEKDLAVHNIGLYADILSHIYHASKPVIAVVNGDVKAGGMGLLAACDILVASEHSTFELSEVLLGIIPANVLPYLMSRRISPQKARYLVLTAARLNALEARNIGLLDEVHPADQLEKAVKALVKTLFRAAPHAVAQAKQFTARLYGETLDQASLMAQETLLEILQQPEVLAGVAAFNQGETPAWFGKFKPTDSII